MMPNHNYIYFQFQFLKGLPNIGTIFLISMTNNNPILTINILMITVRIIMKKVVAVLSIMMYIMKIMKKMLQHHILHVIPKRRRPVHQDKKHQFYCVMNIQIYRHHHHHHRLRRPYLHVLDSHSQT